LADDLLVPILKEMAIAAMAAFEIDHVSAQESAHAGDQGALLRFAKQMKVIGKEGPGIDVIESSRARSANRETKSLRSRSVRKIFLFSIPRPIT